MLKARLDCVLLWPFIAPKAVRKGEVSRASGSPAVLRDQRLPWSTLVDCPTFFWIHQTFVREERDGKLTVKISADLLGEGMSLEIFSQLYSEFWFFLYSENSHSWDRWASWCNTEVLSPCLWSIWWGKGWITTCAMLKCGYSLSKLMRYCLSH